MYDSDKFFDQFITRLRPLQLLYCNGDIPIDSSLRSEILALELLESLFVQQRMRSLHEVQRVVSLRIESRDRGFADDPLRIESPDRGFADDPPSLKDWQKRVH